MKMILSLALATLALATTSAYATSDAVSAPKMGASPMQAASDMTNGEVRKVDMDTKKITLKHDEIKNLGMPGMTMVFHVKDPAMLDKVKAGDKVRFSAERMNGALVVTNIEAAK
jgi:Cu/Ag efflux protein CusF